MTKLNFTNVYQVAASLASDMDNDDGVAGDVVDEIIDDMDNDIIDDVASDITNVVDDDGPLVSRPIFELG